MFKVMQKLFGGVVNEQNYAEFQKELGRRFIPKADFNAKLAELKELRAASEEQRVCREEIAAAMAEAEAARASLSELQGEMASAAEEHQQELRQQGLAHLAELALLRAGAKNLQAAGALLNLRDLPQGGEEQEISARVAAMAEDEGTAFLFARSAAPAAADWQGFVPQEAGDLLDGGYAGGFRLRLARAHNEADCLSAIKVKQEAAAQGVILD